MLRKLPKISVITPSYNQGRFIERTIQSILSQQYPNIEYIVIDAGSTDETLIILKKYKDQIKFISEKDKGQSDAINKGLRLCTGDIICYINSDDTFAKNSLISVARYFIKHPDCYWLTGICEIIDENDQKIRSFITFYKNMWLFHFRGISSLLILNYISQPATFWRKDVLKNIGNFEVNLQFSMDYDYWLRIYKRYPLHIIKNELAYFRIHSHSKGVTGLKDQIGEGYKIAKRQTDSMIILIFHRLHDFFTSTLYNYIFS